MYEYPCYLKTVVLKNLLLDPWLSLEYCYAVAGNGCIILMSFCRILSKGSEREALFREALLESS